MFRYGIALISLVAAMALIAGYELGKSSRLPDIRQRTVAVSSASGAAPKHADSPNTWQRITSRAKPLLKATSSDARRNERQAGLPSGPFGHNIPELKRLADTGDADAAYALAKGYRACEFFVPPKDSTEVAQRAEDSTVMQLNVVDQIVDQATSAAKKQGKSIGKVPEIPALSVYQENLRASQEQIRQCADVDVNAAKDWMNWQRRAAELGNPEAELTFWLSVLQHADGLSLEDLIQDKQVAIAALQDAVSRGDPRALVAIGEVLEDGMFAEPDPYLAYAYFYAASQAPYANINTLPWVGQGFLQLLTAGRNTQQYVQRHLDRTGSSLSAAQQLAAQQLGLDLFRKCCQGNGA